MRSKILFVVAGAVLFGLSCAPYKQLKPKPELSAVEQQGYIELKNDKKDFLLKKAKKYFISFPAPQEDHFYLVFDLPAKKKINSFMTADFADKKTYGQKIADESPFPDTESVYPVDTKSPAFYFLIENGPEDLVLNMKYRYTPQWRFKFETKHAEYLSLLMKNVVDRSVYSGIGTTTYLDSFNFTAAIDSVGAHEAELEKVYKELLAIESIFPQRIVNSSDVAYQNYKVLRTKLEDEMNFQKAYRAALGFFAKEKACRGNPEALIGDLDDFIGYFDHKNILAQNVETESRRILKNRMGEVLSFLGMRMSAKEDAAVFDSVKYFTEALPKLTILHNKAEISVPPELVQMMKFVSDFNEAGGALAALKDSMERIGADIKNGPQMPSDDFFKKIITRMASVQSSIPKKIGDQYGLYQGYTCSKALNSGIAKLEADVSAHLGECRQADALVQQVNILKLQNDFGGMLGLLLQSRQLGFLLDKYKDLDRMSLDQQSKNIRSALSNSAWQLAESGLRKLHADRNYLDLAGMLTRKDSEVRDLEDSLYTIIERVTRVRVNKFLEEKVGELENVDSLYADSVFFPVYDVTFSSGSKNELVQKKNTLVADLARMKDFEFPAKAIKLCYEQFVRNPDDNGVLKARAVVTHGNHYKGDDKDLRIRVAECNPLLAKKISKPKDYRRIFALPVTNSRTGKNKYYIRLNIDIPTDANFPVYDVNIKLPKEVAQNAAAAQWYDEISLNKKLLKNEGRFTISAPGADNDYECQITPVQMNKDQNNILEITFTHRSFKSFIVSIMVQKPIIKKN